MQIIYNITLNIDPSIHDEWLSWMKNQHIPQVLGSGKFTKATFSEVLVKEETGGRTYSVQYRAPSREALDAYYKEDAERLRSESLKKFADKMLSFRTELQVVDEFTVNLN
ncbi:MAG: DUF4286 family protein [Bacteroidota bacterium]